VKKLFKLSFWEIFAASIAALFAIPILLILLSLFSGFNDNFAHIYDVVLYEYSLNSFYLVIGVSILVIFIGVITAWLVTNYDFIGKKIFVWALILPLAIPPYILAYVFTEIFDYSGTANNLLRSLNLVSEDYALPNIRTLTGAIIVFSFTLYPYVYLITRVALMSILKPMLDSARVLGLSKLQTFFKVTLPIIRPAILAGTALVAMETLSDFGAVQHFALPTFTTGIFRTWLGMYDLTTAMQLASILLFVICIVLYFERYQRSKQRYSAAGVKSEKLISTKLKGIYSYLAALFCFLPIFFGFVVPVIELITWATAIDNTFNNDFISSSFNTLFLAFLAALITSGIALILNFNARIHAKRSSEEMNNFISMGYAVPGLILAIGITQLLTYIDYILFNTGLIITGSLIGLIFAYVIKSYALSNNVIQSNYKQVSTDIDDSARTLGSNKRKLLFDIHLPLLKTGLLTSFLLVVSEVVKELPATLILRPFNFDTLAVNVYLLASEERMYEAAFPALFIILIGLIPIYFLSKMIDHSRTIDE